MITSLRRGACGVVVAGCLCACAGSSGSPAFQLPAVDRPPQALDEAFAKVQARDAAGARPLFEQALAEARQQGVAQWEAEARRGLAMVLYQERRWDDCRDEMAAALSLFEQVGDRRKAATVAHAMGNLAFERGARSTAAQHYRLAIRHAAALDDKRYQASLTYNLCLSLDPDSGVDREIADGLRLAREVESARVAGQIHHCLGDRAFLQGRFLDALVELHESSALLEASAAEGRLPLARVWVSLGRLHRAHGRIAHAIGFYERALAVQEHAGDLGAAAQSYNAIGVARSLQRRPGNARAAFERALETAQRSGNLAATTFQTINLARWLINIGEAARGVSLLEGIAGSPAIADRENYQSALAYGFLSLKQEARAEEAATAALDAAVDAERRVQSLSLRARARRALGRRDAALADALEAVSQLERLRAGVVPSDVMKLTFGAAHAETFSLAIGLLVERGLQAESLAVAESGRARALADILATRDLSRGRGPTPAGGLGSPPVAPLLRGATAALESEDAAARPSAALSALSAPQLVALARRLRSVVVAYWVGDADTFIWTVSPTGMITGTRTPVARERLEHLVRQVWALPSALARGAPAEDRAAASPGGLVPEPRRRGADLAIVTGDATSALRELHRFLIEPIEEHLPWEAGSRLTIVPHGPLFSLSFAALRDSAGRYLVERYTLHYGASGAVLDQATREPEARTPGRRRYVFVADPARLPDAPDAQPLPRLPGSRREVTEVARLLPASQVTILAGPNALEDRVGRAATGGRVLHFATHGIVLDERPQASFLALSRPSPRSGEVASSPGDVTVSTLDPLDGRLTADEVYGLRLDADMVVLSACRTGLGQLTGDGMVGLTRAFLVAGARSIVASLWDVADEPAARLMPAFYRERLAGADKSVALREAQLGLLRALRAGRVTVATARGPRALPEHPVFWATFVLTGEP